MSGSACVPQGKSCDGTPSDPNPYCCEGLQCDLGPGFAVCNPTPEADSPHPVQDAAIAPPAATANATQPRHNVLFIAIDDLRPELSNYGFAHMSTPNIQKLADRGTTFTRAYVSVALCMPSRTAMLTSRRPDTTKNWAISPDQWFRNCGGNNCSGNVCGAAHGCGMPDAVTIPQYFKQTRAFEVAGTGKIYHCGANTHFQDYQHAWTCNKTPFFCPGPPTGIYDPSNEVRPTTWDGNPSWFAFPDNQTELLRGTIIKDAAVAALGGAPVKGSRIKPLTEPFALFVGFHKPHVPWYAPAKYWDLYPNDTISAPPHPGTPTNVPDIALQKTMLGWTSCGHGDAASAVEVEDDGVVRADGGKGPRYADLCHQLNPETGTTPISADYPYDNTTIPAWKTKELRRAYWAATSYTDANVGEVLGALDASKFANNTIIVLWGDHGYQLGDNDEWAKQDNFEHATRASRS